MKSIFKVLSILAAGAFMIACGEKEEPANSTEDDKQEEQGGQQGGTTVSKTVKVTAMSFNIKYPASDDLNEKAWDNRKVGVVEMLKTKKPDLVGLQECYISQRSYIIENLPHYDCYGLVKTSGKDSGSGETMSILWNKDKFEKLECGTFWLTEKDITTPNKGWGAANTRNCTWILFKDKETGKKFYHFNTHLDHQVEAAQRGGATLIREQMKAMNTEKLPVILTGDMNVEDKKSEDNFLFGLFEMKNARKESGSDDYGVTCHGYSSTKTQVIDYIFYEGMEPWYFQTIKGPWAGFTYISDHNPVMSELRFK